MLCVCGFCFVLSRTGVNRFKKQEKKKREKNKKGFSKIACVYWG